MIQLFEANQLNELAGIISENLIVQASDMNPFLEDWIVVQNKETQTWLQSEISKHNGIAANLKFVFPNELAWQILRILKPDLSVDLPTDRTALQVRIFDFLEKNRKELSKKGLNIPQDAAATLNLANSISDVFDLYQIFRPEMLKNWTKNPVSSTDSKSWQSFLWKEIITGIKHEFADQPSRFELIDYIKSFLVKEQLSLPKRISIFGLSHWSKSLFEFIELISEKVHIDWYDQQINIDATYHKRFSSWVKPKHEVKEFFNSSNLKTEIQRIIKNPSHFSLVNTEVHSCHNPEREVQVLKNSLLTYLDHNTSCSVDDVLVLVPDFEQYAPIIQNEFNSRDPFPSIPVYIPEFANNSSYDLVNQLFDFFINGEKVNDFNELLNHTCLKNSFNFSETDLRFYSSVFAEMNIHHGLNTSDSSFSIEKGIDQLLLSSILGGESYKTFKNFSILELRNSSEVKENLRKTLLDILSKYPTVFML